MWKNLATLCTQLSAHLFSHAFTHWRSMRTRWRRDVLKSHSCTWESQDCSLVQEKYHLPFFFFCQSNVWAKQTQQETRESRRCVQRSGLPIWGFTAGWEATGHVYFVCPETHDKLGRSRRTATQFCRRSGYASAAPDHVLHSLNQDLAASIKQLAMTASHHCHWMNCFPAHVDRDWTKPKMT